MSKKLLLDIFSLFGGCVVTRKITAGTPKVLMYHRFSKIKEQGKISIDTFEEQLKIIKKYYDVVSVGELSEIIFKKNSVHKNLLAITIDDGYMDFYNYAFPVLKKYNLPATIYVTTDFVDHKTWLWPDLIHYALEKTKKNKILLNIENREVVINNAIEERQSSWSKLVKECINNSGEVKNAILNQVMESTEISMPDIIPEEYLPLTWEQIHEMDKNKIEIGAHTLSHPILSKISINDQKREIAESKKRIENKLQRKINSFCYPNGQQNDYDDKTMQLVKEEGYSSAVVAHFNINKSFEQFELSRYNAGENSYQFFKTIHGIKYLSEKYLN